jgi:hypothetical protein
MSWDTLNTSPHRNNDFGLKGQEASSMGQLKSRVNISYAETEIIHKVLTLAGPLAISLTVSYPCHRRYLWSHLLFTETLLAFQIF